MAPNDESPTSRVQSSYQKLSAAAATLNKASDELGTVVAELDAALKALNLGITSWLAFRSWGDALGIESGKDHIGYDRIGGKWGIAIRRTSFHSYSGEESCDEWLFNDAPRALRLLAVDKIPELLEKLTKDVEDATRRIDEKVMESQELAKAINAVAKVRQSPAATTRSSRLKPLEPPPRPSQPPSVPGRPKSLGPPPSPVPPARAPTPKRPSYPPTSPEIDVSEAGGKPVPK
jgi:hypothetical protein